MEEKVSRFGPPLVSVVITNYNYGRFVEDAVASVFAQTYPNVECIIVDDASTDDSRSIIDALAQREPRLKLSPHETNRGQTMAFRTGLLASRGEYIVFLDADDYLLPRFIETHVFVHLSSRMAVAFTSSDMAQTKGRRVVTTAWERMNHYVLSGKGRRDDLLRRIDICAPDVWPMKSDGLHEIESRVHFVDTTHEWEDWVYAPTSGNCFRRDALDILLGADDVEELKFYADSYVNKGACLISGAILIDLPLFLYRFHDRNGAGHHPELYGFCGVDLGKAAQADHIAWRKLVDRLTAEGASLVPKIGLMRYAAMLITLQRASAMVPRPDGASDPEKYVAAKLDECVASLGEKIGKGDLLLLRSKLSTARRRQGAKRRVAEFFLTLGRTLDAPRISALGERLWGS